MRPQRLLHWYQPCHTWSLVAHTKVSFVFSLLMLPQSCKCLARELTCLRFHVTVGNEASQGPGHVVLGQLPVQLLQVVLQLRRLCWPLLRCAVLQSTIWSPHVVVLLKHGHTHSNAELLLHHQGKCLSLLDDIPCRWSKEVHTMLFVAGLCLSCWICMSRVLSS